MSGFIFLRENRLLNILNADPMTFQVIKPIFAGCVQDTNTTAYLRS